jgi:hypothetical protein
MEPVPTLMPRHRPWHPRAVTATPSSWLAVPDVAERLGTTPTKVRQLLEERLLLGSRRTGVLLIPEVMVEGGTLNELPGTATLLLDGGFSLDEALDWLIEDSEELGASPIAALRQGRKKEVRRIAQGLAV